MLVFKNPYSSENGKESTISLLTHHYLLSLASQYRPPSRSRTSMDSEAITPAPNPDGHSITHASYGFPDSDFQMFTISLDVANFTSDVMSAVNKPFPANQPRYMSTAAMTRLKEIMETTEWKDRVDFAYAVTTFKRSDDDADVKSNGARLGGRRKKQWSLVDEVLRPFRKLRDMPWC